MGNLSGLYRRGGLPLEAVLPVAEAVVADFFPTLLEARLTHGVLVFEWVNPHDKAFGTLMAWEQVNGARVGGKNPRHGALGEWLQHVLRNRIAERLPGNVKLWYEGQRQMADPDSGEGDEFWDWLRADYPPSWQATVAGIRFRAEYLKRRRMPVGLPDTVLGSMPAWAFQEQGTPPPEPWFKPDE